MSSVPVRTSARDLWNTLRVPPTASPTSASALTSTSFRHSTKTIVRQGRERARVWERCSISFFARGVSGARTVFLFLFVLFLGFFVASFVQLSAWVIIILWIFLARGVCPLLFCCWEIFTTAPRPALIHTPTYMHTYACTDNSFADFLITQTKYER